MAEKASPGIVVNADDMGIHPAISAGILSAYRNGIVTSTSLIVTMPDRHDAISGIVRPSEIPAGLHLSLTEGQPISEPVKIPALADENGRFRIPATRLVTLQQNEGTRRLFEQIGTEIEAQLALAKDYGLSLTHVDSHQHVHMNPAIFQLLEQIAPRFGVRRIRLTREPASSFLLAGEHSQALKDLNPVKWLTTRFLARKIKPRLETTEQFFGLLHSGLMSKRILTAFLKRASPAASIEVCVHPGFAPHDATQDDPINAFQLSPYRQYEHAALVDEETKVIVRARGLRLVSHAGVEKSV